MTIDAGLATVSDQLFGAAAASYTLALLCAAVEFSSQRSKRALAHASAEVGVEMSAREYASVGAAGGYLTKDGTPTGDPVIGTAMPHESIGRVDKASEPGWGERFGKVALVVTVLGFLAHIVSIVTRGMAAGRVPLGNMYEFTSLICATAVGAWLFFKIRQRTLAIGVFVMVPVIILMYVAGAVLHVEAMDVQPALKSYWKWIHVSTVSLSSGILMFSGVASLLYVQRARFERKGSNPKSVWAKLPELATLDRIAYRTAIMAFPLFTFAVITGALWAEVAWGRYWNWDPKETCAFVTWVVYAAYLHARSTAGWRGSRAAWISVFGFVTVLFNLFFINIVVAGLHSYAGLN
ncbi:c-type cytochrome biogenesis protein CcsB [Nakamurella antarctica]|uniref:C-type cytochrome biogenesis protein CcsB n=1 Tax=Nakamurella antarctica TaxID=1902245 RepID=A0A3G8ZPP1_9ACTN|nr:c-type cytochrome biogenesis protein CcsB [Nakamurella antarctica]AZI58757.1 c-type cytochrome biogenesis protein CcsB [Nakamurella antarctica]